MKKYLFFDTETTGVDQEFDHIVQLAAILTDENGKHLVTMDEIILPIGYTIPQRSTEIHGISQSKAIAEGISIIVALNKFMGMVSAADHLVAHNAHFDTGFLVEELLRNDMLSSSEELSSREFYCTMKSTTEFCKLNYNPTHKTYKWPKLVELYHRLFGTTFYGAHNALIDVEATIRCFFELKSKHGFYSN